jgi:hypothetical protein
MERIDPHHLSDIILAAPAWARLGITMPDEALRVRAATELALTISERLTEAVTIISRDQLSLPL